MEDCKQGQSNGTTVEEILQKRLPVSKESASVDLRWCRVTEEGCSALRSNSRLTKLHLFGNNLKDSGVKILSESLKDSDCNVYKLSLRRCGVTEEGCSALTSALRSNSRLTELDLSDNEDLSDSGVKILSESLKDSDCNLQKLSLSDCGVTEEGCSALTSALRSNSRLTELDLSENYLSDSGVEILSELLKGSSRCNLQKLSLSDCGVTEEGCSALTSALRSNSRLTELDLTDNDLCDSGVKILSESLKDSDCNLQKLSLSRCDVTEEGCSALASALRSNSRLTELDLSYNFNLKNSGVKILSELLKDSDCHLQKLSLSWCGVTKRGCSALTSALRSNSHLTELDLSWNDLNNSGVRNLSELLKDSSRCNLHKLSLSCCGVTEEGCSALASALRSNSRLTELDLSQNYNLKNSGVKNLSESLKDSSRCNLQKLSLRWCRVTEEGCSALTSALRSNSRLTELDLSWNDLNNSGVRNLCESLKDSRCNLQKLSLSRCRVTEKGCSALTSALRSNSRLTELDLSQNYDLSDSGVKILSGLLKDSDCNLQKLSLSDCGVTEEGCSALTSALRSNSRLTELDLSGNYPRDSGVEILSESLKDSDCNLHKLSLRWCRVTSEDCSALTSALRSCLTELDLTETSEKLL